MIADALKPIDLGSVAAAVREADSVRILGSGSKRDWLTSPGAPGTPISLASYSGIVDFSPNDQVVAVRAGTTLEELQDALRPAKQCIPYAAIPLPGFEARTLGGAVALNLPHLLEAECGSWRDWVLGMTLVRPDGTIAKSGSHAVKNVAGYDVHKLMIGARGTLAVIAEVILRTYPIKSLPTPEVVHRAGDPSPACWVQRTLARDFARAAEAAPGAGLDVLHSHTLVRCLHVGATLPRYEGDWVIRSACGTENVVIEDAVLRALMERTKHTLDPNRKLNPGELGL